MSVPIFPNPPGAFGSETSPYSSVITTSSGASTSVTLPVGQVMGILGAHSTLRLNTGTTAISTSPSTFQTAGLSFGPILSDGSSFSIVNDTTGSASYYWLQRPGGVTS